MPSHRRFSLPDHLAFAAYVATWLPLAAGLGMVVGTAVAGFLWSLDEVTRLRFEHPGLLFALPLAGGLVGWLYATWGKAVEAGNNLIVDEIHEPGGGVPLRMAPLVFLGTVVTHLCGGSAGREGTAVQMGGALAGGLARMLPGVRSTDIPALLMAGLAAGFGGVFGTPVAGAIFALEVLAIGRIRHDAILPCLVAAVVSDQTCLAWGISHTPYHVEPILNSGTGPAALVGSWRFLAAAAVGGILFGWTGTLFAGLAHATQRVFARVVTVPVLRPVVGGCLVIALVELLGTRDYLGLGVTSPDPAATTIVTAFEPGGAGLWSWWWKIVFTAITLGSGFKGGEVTPLFFIGATLGNTLATLAGLPVDFMAALGFVAVFAGATNTPVACIVLAVELFGGANVPYFAVAVVFAYLASGHAGIYSAQRIATPKPVRRAV
jgi:H+/Cl- antiporter ClcA